jgi:hypothetical protein
MMTNRRKWPDGRGLVDALDRVGGLTGGRWPPAPPASKTSDHPWPLAVRLTLIGVSLGLGTASAALLLMPRPYSALAASGLSLSCVLLSQMVIWFFPGTRARLSLGRYRLPLLLSLSFYLIALFGALILFRFGFAEGPAGYLIAAAPAVPLAGAAIVAALFLKNDADELMRRMTAQSALWAGGFTLVETTVWGFLETFGLAPHLWLWTVTVAFFVQLSVAGVVVGRRYR